MSRATDRAADDQRLGLLRVPRTCGYRTASSHLPGRFNANLLTRSPKLTAFAAHFHAKASRPPSFRRRSKVGRRLKTHSSQYRRAV